MSDLSPPRRPVVILLAGLAWLVAAVGAVVTVAAFPPLPAGPLELARALATLVLTVAAPLAIVLAGLELVRRPRRDSGGQLDDLETRTAAAGTATAAVRDGLLDVDATLAAIASRLDGLRASAAANGTGLVDAAGQLESAAATLNAAGDTAVSSVRGLTAILPDARHQAEGVAALLTTTSAETARQLGEVETMLAAVWARNADAQEQTAAAGVAAAGLIAGIEHAATTAGDTISARAATLDVGVDAALDRTTNALDATREAVHVQTNALLASVDQARVALDAIGGEAARSISERIDHVIAATDALGVKLADHDARAAAMVAAIERSFTVLDKRLSHAATMGTATLDGFHARMTAIRDTADRLDPPLVATNAALRDAETAVRRLAEEAGTTIATLGKHLPAEREAVAGLTSDIASLSERTQALAAPAAALSSELTVARATLAAIEGSAQGSALTASTALIEVLGRVREIANSTAGAMRTTLDGVVAEAEAALAQAGTTRAAAAFGDPIRAEIAGLEGASAMAGAAAQAAADRIAARLLGLTAVVATIEARVAEVEGRSVGDTGNARSVDPSSLPREGSPSRWWRSGAARP